MAKKRKRLAVFVGQGDESFQRRFIKGFSGRAFEMRKDVCVFSMYRKYQDVSERERGETNILALANPKYFDGIVILKDTIQTAGAADELETRIHEGFDGPVFVVDLQSKYFHSVSIDGFTPVKELTNHLIEDHGLKHLAFLCGKKNHPHSLQRLAAFKKAMTEHDLEVPDYWVVEGDFWYNSGEKCLDYLLNNGHPMPEGVVCANDCMAIGLCKALTEKGIRVPEDIVVVGADSADEGMSSPKVLTSYETPAEELGSYVVDALESIKADKTPEPFMGKSKLIHGETCGCTGLSGSGRNIRRLNWGTELSEEGFYSLNNSMFDELIEQTDVFDYISAVYSYAYQIEGVESFHLCLVKDIKNMDVRELPVNEGYPDEMLYAIKYSKDRMGDMVSLNLSFDTEKMLPDLFDAVGDPRIYIFTPVFNGNRCFGYSVICYGNNPRSYDDTYRRWIRTVSFGLEALRRNMIISELQEKLTHMKRAKFDKFEAVFESLSTDEKEDYELVKNIIDQNLLNYYFQPIVSAEDGSIYSFEALMRSGTRRNITPLAILKYAGMQERFPDIESATFKNVIRIIEKNKSRLNGTKVFINSIPGVHVEDFDEIARKLSDNSDVIVVELTEEAELNEAELNRLKEFFRKINIEIAVDDYGTGYSNISNLLRYMPNYVKIDRSLLSEIQNKPQKQHFVREIIEFCHHNNIKALAEGVESAEELRMVIHLGADLIQGFYTGLPAPDFVDKIDDKVINEIKSYYQERTDGKAKRIYTAGKTYRISLLALAKDECTDIVVGQDGMVYNDIAIVGTPSLKTEMHIRVESNYRGRITLENVSFSNIKDRPCIDIGENSTVVLELEGNNEFINTGIRVPESSKLIIDGKGNLQINLTSTEYYGIGNDKESTHGDISFVQDGKISINGNGNDGVLIGSGYGGKIVIAKGLYNLNGHGNRLVGIGSLYSECDLSISYCGMEMDLSADDFVGIGSLDKSAIVNISKSSVKIVGNGLCAAGIGSLNGDKSEIILKNGLTEVYLRADHSTAIGAFNGSSVINSVLSTVRIENAGAKALAFGGMSEDTGVSLTSVDTRVNIHNTLDKDTFAPEDRFSMLNGRCNIKVNDKDIERELIFRFDSENDSL